MQPNMNNGECQVSNKSYQQHIKKTAFLGDNQSRMLQKPKQNKRQTSVIDTSKIQLLPTLPPELACGMFSNFSYWFYYHCISS